MVHIFFASTCLVFLMLIVDPVHSQDHHQIDAADFLKLVNWRRRMFAKVFRHPSMYELAWDKDLEEVSKGSWDPKKKVGNNYRSRLAKGGYTRAVYFLREGMHEFHDKDTANKLEEFLNKWENDDINDMEFFVPDQKKIGCSAKWHENENWLHCVLGPKTQLTSMKDWKGEKAGTKCNKGDTEIDGLCRWSGRDGDGEDDGKGDSFVSGSSTVGPQLLMILFFLYKYI
ncbi:hypothetical protein CAEBREN_22040 [Caenorhabditis brenneri]|uniref:SCP domain-containing protein n=1 Tax=Caenorhabditis brenneri TaxID=135651 RepID=G0MCR0_CAEBE|nr:hypothetical protein CAEBREN_22040 [Caenorhabditis brenneri]